MEQAIASNIFICYKWIQLFQKLKATLKTKSVQVTWLEKKSHSPYNHSAMKVLQHAFHYYVRFNIKRYGNRKLNLI
jgi:hypothetical protein